MVCGVNAGITSGSELESFNAIARHAASSAFVNPGQPGHINFCKEAE